MQARDLVNHRLSYHVVVTFDLINNKDTSVYSQIKELFAERLELQNYTSTSEDEGGKEIELPFNTFATIYHKEDDAKDLKDWFSKEIAKIFKELKLKARYFIAVADNWSVGAYFAK